MNLFKKRNISFIIPAYNCAKFLPEAINSIFNGNFTQGDEVIIIDDASTDNTFKVAKNLQKKYPAIRIFQHHYNKGSAAAGRNTGIDNSKNDLIFCLDADNVLAPNSIPELNFFMFKNNADSVAFGELHFFKKKMQNVTHKWVYKEKITIYDVINNTTATPCASGNYLFTKISWLKAGRYNESSSMVAYDSWAFGFNQLVAGAKMITLPNTFYYHRYGYDSTYVREIKKINPSITMMQVLLPHIDLFDNKAVNYMLSRKGRYVWRDNIERHFIRLKQHNHINLLSKIHSWLPVNKLENILSKIRI